MRRSTVALLTCLNLFASTAPPESQAQGQATGLRVLSREGSRTLPTVTINNQEYVALDEVANNFGLTLREDRLAGGVTATAGAQSIIITADQPVASVSGRLVSLSTAPVRQGNRWLVPLDFLQRALGPALETRIELRRASRVLVVGEVRIPRVTTRVEQAPMGATIVFDITPATPTRITMENDRLIVQFEADGLDLQLPTVAPQDPSRLVMFFSGMKLGGNGGSIGKAWATAADPFTWHEDERNPVLLDRTPHRRPGMSACGSIR